jgi:hypothetical protein
MQRLRPETPGSRPDARRQRPLPVLRYPPGARLLGLRPAAYRRRDHRCRAGLRLVLPGSAAAMRALRPDPQDRQAGDSNHSGLVLQLLQGCGGGLLGLRGNQALPADLLGQPDLPHLPGPPSPACFRCGRDRPVQAEWPAGPVCTGCYEHVRRHPAECAACGAVRPLVGSDEQARPVCGPCAGAPGLDYACRECGRAGQIHSSRRCFGCVLAERARILLAGPGGTSPPSCIPCWRR